VISERVRTGCEKLDEKIGGLRRGDIVLVLGPPLGGKKIFSRSFIAEGLREGESCILCCTNSTAEQEHEALKSLLEEDVDKLLEEGFLAYIDMFSGTIGLSLEERPYLRRIPSVVDLASFNVALREILSSMNRKERKIRLVFDSISTILIYNPFQTVSRFLHILFGRLKSSKVTSLFLLEEEAHEKSMVATIIGICDGVLRIKSENDVKLLKYESEIVRTDWISC